MEFRNFSWYSIGYPYATVECFLKVNKAQVEIAVPLYGLFDNVTENEDLLCCTSVSPESSSRNHLSTSFAILSMIILPNILDVVAKSEIPRRLPHDVKSSFFDSFIVIPFSQTCGTSSVSHIDRKISCNMFTAMWYQL